MIVAHMNEKRKWFSKSFFIFSLPLEYIGKREGMAVDMAREQRVWNRVTAPISGGQSREELRILLMNAGELMDLIQNLTGKVSRGRDLIKQILQQEQANLRSLKGMLIFAGQEITFSARKATPAPVKQALIRGYYLAKKAAAEYTARSVDPEFGVVYQEMAAREIQICNLIIRLLGELF